MLHNEIYIVVGDPLVNCGSAVNHNKQSELVLLKQSLKDDSQVLHSTQT